MAALRVGALKLPLDVHVGIELRDVVRTIGKRRTDRAVEVAIEPGLVMIVFDDDGVRAIVLPHAGSRIPTEAVGALEISRRVEFEQMSASAVVSSSCPV